MRSPLHLALGLLGALGVALGACVWWRVVSGPGDDNPIALAGVAAVALGAVPSWGLVLWLRRRPLRGHLVWLFLAGAAAVPLAAICVILLTVLLG